ncbi:hypothetical protein BM221_004998 [Beauveria bassiana]|uniref:Uncharacterized protein n=1 Tax=Beauveria bassiana TaxID=176275 RepID=A0A2N6NMC1_BEABA|nr:hypothetical protein BM221_004998 [Beauveria bassiana]
MTRAKGCYEDNMYATERHGGKDQLGAGQGYDFGAGGVEMCNAKWITRLRERPDDKTGNSVERERINEENN